jgi:hypothetical protein
LLAVLVSPGHSESPEATSESALFFNASEIPALRSMPAYGAGTV